MKKQSFVILILIFTICLSSVIYADTLSRSGYKAYTGYNGDYGMIV